MEISPPLKIRCKNGSNLIWRSYKGDSEWRERQNVVVLCSEKSNWIFRHFPGKSCPECFCECFSPLHHYEFTPCFNDVYWACSNLLCEDSFCSVNVGVCYKTVCTAQWERDGLAKVPHSGNNQNPWILSDKLSDLSLVLLYCVTWQIYDSQPVWPGCDWSMRTKR